MSMHLMGLVDLLRLLEVPDDPDHAGDESRMFLGRDRLQEQVPPDEALGVSQDLCALKLLLS